MSEERLSNVLGRQKSPYLLQHAGNPVHWQPWSDEAFALARELDRPVFISIGYATCHWCHVMAHESFEDDAIADYLNQHYVCIKVDREERPDVDGMYMDVCQAMTGHGGWPLTIFTDADRRPFFAGTYFPPRSQANRIGFIDLISRVHQAWSTDRDQVLASAQEIVRTLQEGASADFRGDVPSSVFTTVADHHQRTFDDTHGGFNAQPKFPSPHHLLLLFRIGHRTGNTELIRMATHTLTAMRAGGIYDQVGYGFHRYSTDREWLVPHFEKMLYDQAMLLMAYTEAWQITGDALYQRTAEEILAYLQREMTSTEGAFFSAQDADSEGVEGKYYVWAYSELVETVGQDHADWLVEHLNVRPDGNFHDEATGNATGLNILHWGLQGALATDTNVQERWTTIRTLLLDRRVERIHPLTDDKILTDWNGLMIGALARAGRAFDQPSFTSAATTAYDAIASLCGGADWVHRYREGDRAVAAMLDDHAAMGWAGLELYQTTGDERFLKDAVHHADTIATQFTDANGASFMAAEQHQAELPVQQRDGFDSAYPCGNSMSAWLFAGLSVILDKDDYRERARAAVTTYGTQIERFAPGFCMLLCAWDVLLHGSTEMGIVGKRTSDLVQSATALIGSAFLPDAYIVWQPEEKTTLLSEQYPFAGAPSPSVLVCKQYACQSPITSMGDLEDYLGSEAR